MKRRQFLKGMLYGTGGTMLLAGGYGTFTKLDARQAMAVSDERDEVVYSACEMCRNQCPVAARVKNGKVVKVEGNPYDPTVQGTLCARGQAAPSLLYDPQRLKKPMIRTGERGSGKFKEVSWEEAYSYIAESLKKITGEFGPESVVFSSRKGPHDWFFRTLGKAIGTPNLFSHEATCPLTRTVALDTTIGSEGITADYGNTQYLISVGRNWFEGIKVPEVRGINKALANGAKLVVLDPRFSVTAAKGEWIPIKPTTELAFVMAMANVLLKENLYNHNFVEQYTVGFEKWEEAVKDKTPEWAENETGIPKDTITRIAKEFAAAAPKAILDYGWRTGLTTNDYQLRRAILIVNMMIGNFEVPGGYYQNKASSVITGYPDLAAYAKQLGGVKQPAFPVPQKPRIDGAGIKGTPNQLIPLYDGAVGQIPVSIITTQPYAIKAWMVHRFNPVISLQDTDYTLEAIKRLDLLVTCDVYMTDTAYFSDVILPECTYLERYEPVFDMSGLTPRYVLRQPVISPVYPDTKSASQIYKELGETMGFGQYFPYKDMEDYLNQQLMPSGLSLSQLKEKGVWVPEGMPSFYAREKDPQAPLENVLFSHNKKINIFSEEIEEATGEGVPVYVSHPQPQEGEFRFVQGKVAVHTNAGTANVPVLNELMPINTLWINTESAKKLGIKDGDEIKIVSSINEHQGKAKVTEAIRPDTVFAYHGFGRISPELKRAFGKGINGNKLIKTKIGITGNAVTSMDFVKIKKA